MSFFNEERYIEQAIRSILDQTYEHLELIAIDDYSTDASADICASIGDPRIRLIRKTSEPRYLAASRNLGVAMARGEYVTFQDADDLAHPRRIELQLRHALAGAGRCVVGCSVVRVEPDRQRIMAMPESHEEICRGFTRVRNRTTLVGGTLFAPRSVLQEVPYREQFRYMQDWDHLLRLYESGRVTFGNCPEPLYTYFIRSKGVLGKSAWLEYNLYVRHCQTRRRRAEPELDSLTAFRNHLQSHPLAWLKWRSLGGLIRLKQMLNGLTGRVLRISGVTQRTAVGTVDTLTAEESDISSCLRHPEEKSVSRSPEETGNSLTNSNRDEADRRMHPAPESEVIR